MFKTVFFTVIAAFVLLGGCATKQSADANKGRSIEDRIQVIEIRPPTPDARSKLAEQDRDAWAKKLRELRFELRTQLEILRVSSEQKLDPRVATEDWDEFKAEVEFTLLLHDLLESLFQGLEKGETFSKPAEDALFALVDVQRLLNQQVTDRLGIHERLVRAQALEQPISSEWRGWIQRITLREDPLEAATSVFAVSSLSAQIVRKGSAREGDWRRIDQWSLDAQRFHQVSEIIRPLAGSRHTDVEREETLRRIGATARLLVSLRLEYLDTTLADRATELASQDLSLFRGKGLQDRAATTNFVAWYFFGQEASTPFTREAFGQSVNHWLIFREILPEAMQGSVSLDIEPLKAELREMDDVFAQAVPAGE
jgi:hypothetical protein